MTKERKPHAQQLKGFRFLTLRQLENETQNQSWACCNLEKLLGEQYYDEPQEKVAYVWK